MRVVTQRKGPLMTAVNDVPLTRLEAHASPAVDFRAHSHVKSDRLNCISVTVWNPKATPKQRAAVINTGQVLSSAFLVVPIALAMTALLTTAASAGGGWQGLVFGALAMVFAGGAAWFAVELVKAARGRRAALAAFHEVAPGESIRRTLTIAHSELDAMGVMRRAQAAMSDRAAAAQIRDLLWNAGPGYVSAADFRELAALVEPVRAR